MRLVILFFFSNGGLLGHYYIQMRNVLSVFNHASDAPVNSQCGNVNSQ